MSFTIVKKSVRSICATSNQETISKFFLSDATFSTPLRKRNAETGLKDHALSPLKKLIKQDQQLVESDDLETNSPGTAKILQSFIFQKCKDAVSNNDNSSQSVSGLPKNSDLDSGSSIPQFDGCDEHLKSTLTEANVSSLMVPKYTPLEKQYLQFRSEYPDTILIVECGYKYKIFGEDAKIVSSLFNLAYFKSHNFMSARILPSRLHFYVRRLVSKGYKVGVIKQAETAALKAAGESKNDLFCRKLDALYTKSTLLGEEFSITSTDNELESDEGIDADSTSEYLMCIYEDLSENCKKNSKNIAFVAVQVSSGDVSYAVFEDTAFRNQLETHLMHVDPGEILLSSHLSNDTERVLTAFTLERSIRTEKVSKDIFEYSFALDKVCSFFTAKASDSSGGDILQTILLLSPLVISCLSALIHHLSQFQLESALNSIKTMKALSTDNNPILSSTTLKGLEIFSTNSSRTEHGSLFWLINRTQTKCGERLLKYWLSKPLKNKVLVEERLDIITEILHSESIAFKVLEEALKKLPDLERILCCVFHQKCGCFDFLKLLQAFMKIKRELFSVSDIINADIKVPRLKSILLDLPELLEDVESYLSNLDPTAAKDGDKTKVFCNISMFPTLNECQENTTAAEHKLDSLRPEMAKLLKMISVKYSTVNGQKYLIEVPHSQLCLVPNNWLKISSTKHVARFKPPEVMKLSNEIEQQREAMIVQANKAWLVYLKGFGKRFHKHKRAVSYLAELDCYLSLAKVAKEENYCRPQIVDAEEQVFHVSNGWHPMIKKIMEADNQFVANDIHLDDTNRCIIVTGPNMGGKSTYVRQTALIAIMAQIGSYLPAESAKLSIFDNIYVRMCSEDPSAQAKSTFLTEMTETSEILCKISSKSFVILDELGRGTSTHDGTAIAYSVLENLITEVRCLGMFVTHYPEIVELENRYPGTASTIHMGYLLKEAEDDTDIETVTFLFNVVPGASEKSYGINVAALAGIPREILLEAQNKSREMELNAKIKRAIKNLIMKIKSSTKVPVRSTLS